MKEQIIKFISDPELSFEERIESIEKVLMIESLERNNWIKLKAANELKVTYRIFNYKYEKYALQEMNPRKRRKKNLQEVAC